MKERPIHEDRRISINEQNEKLLEKLYKKKGEGANVNNLIGAVERELENSLPKLKVEKQ